MKNIFFLLSTIFIFIYCSGQNKDENIKSKHKFEDKFYLAKCIGDYSTEKKITEKERCWSLSQKDIDEIIKLSSEITENELHFSYPVTPCNIEVKGYEYKDKNYNLSINGGSYISLSNGKNNILLGCDSPVCKKYFLQPKGEMVDIHQSLITENLNSETKNYNINLNKDKFEDLIIVKNNTLQIILGSESKNTSLLTKSFDCDFIDIEINTKYNQAFNLILNYFDQYQKPFRKIVIPVFYNKSIFFIKKLFVASLGTSANTGNEEWHNKEINENVSLEQLDINSILSK